MHIIRLHGPWEYEPLARTALQPDGTTVEESASLPPPGRTTIPSDWSETLGADFRGRVRYTRRFHRPTGLETGQRVWLVVDGVDAWGAVLLNGKRLGTASLTGGPFRFDVTDGLAVRNELNIEVELPEPAAGDPSRPGREGLAGGLIGSVRLEIEE